MAYCNLTDIKNAIPETNLVQLTDDDNTGSIDQDKVDAAILNADNTIDSFLRGRYTVPLSPVPGIITKLSVDLAIFDLYTRRFEMETPEGIRDRHKNAVKMLTMMQRGEITLLEDTGGESRVYKTNKTSDDREFPKSKLDSY